MRSNIRLFGERKYLSGGLTDVSNILPYNEFKMCRDIENQVINPEFGDFMVKKAEAYLDEEIPMLPLSMYREYRTPGMKNAGVRAH